MNISIQANLRYVFGEMCRKLTKYWGKMQFLPKKKVAEGRKLQKRNKYPPNPIGCSKKHLF